jgi:endoglucanase
MKRTALIISVLSLIIISNNATASKLVWLKVVDNNFIMAQFKDGDACFADTGTGTNAYTGNHYYGWDWITNYGTALNTTTAVATANWTITSADDATYAAGLHPTNCYRKSKLTGMSEGEWIGDPTNDYAYTYALEHGIFLKLPYPMAQGKTYTIEINSNTNSDTLSKTINYDIYNCPSEAVHANLVGYLADASTKAVDLFIWMGDGGARDYSSFVGKKVYIYNVNTSASQQVGTVALWKNNGGDVGGYNFTMSNVWKADFTGFNTPGTYRVAVEGVGCSENFEIKKYAYFEPFRVNTIGFFYMRIGEDSNYPGMPVPRRPLFIPNVSPSNTKVYITTMQPWASGWSSIPDDKWDNPTSWAAYSTGVQNNDAFGGHSDAADWDRHQGHISIIYDMLLPYILTDGRMNNDNLQIVESGNGIPDLLDEARNEVDFWLSLHDANGNGYGYGVTNPTGNTLYQAGTTAISAWASAVNASMLANCFMLAGINDLKDYYTNAAVTAYNYASGLSDQQLTITQSIGDYTVRGKDLKMTAAAFLYNLTNDVNYENMLNSLCDITSTTSPVVNSGRDQLYACAAYLKTKRTVNKTTLFNNMKASIINEAKNVESNNANNRPSRRSSDNSTGWFKTTQNVIRCVVAHAVATSQSDKDTFENAMVLEADWGLGRNALNMIFMTTACTNLASERSVENAYTTGRNDGYPGVHPGHTPYMNTEDWGGTMVMGKPSWMTAKCYPSYGDNMTTGWPKVEGYFNTRYVYANSEFTPQQTMHGKAALYGYLYGLYKIAADFDGDADVDLLDLVDFADSWLKVPGNPGYDSRANLYADSTGIVDSQDFAVFANQWKK